MPNISGYGTQVLVQASNTFPTGFLVTQFSDDADALDVPSIQINDKAMGVNGDLLVWSKANPLLLTLNVIPGSDDDINLGILFEANRVAKNKVSARDTITLAISYPDGRNSLLSGGAITDGIPTDGVQSAGRLKTKNYSFAFEGLTKATI